MRNKSCCSLKVKTYIGVFALVLITFAMTASFSFFNNDAKLKSKISQTVRLMMEKKQNELDTNFTAVEDAVRAAENYILRTIDEERILKDPEYEKKYMSALAEEMTNYPGSPKGVVTVFFRMAEDRFGSRKGFFFRGNKKTGFVKIRSTDITKYSPSDMEHVGWYFIPLWEKKPVWMNPYENKNINLHIISYVIPIYKNEKFLGVVGMDIALAVLKDIVDTLPIENTLALLIGREKNLIYSNHSYFLRNAVDQSANVKSVVDFFKGGTSNSLEDFIWNRTRHLGFLKRLENGMSLVIAVPYSMFASARLNQLIFYSVALLLTLVLTWISVYFFSKRIILPIRALREATFKLSRGELCSNISYKSKNEIGILADNIRKMTSQMKEYIDYIREQTAREREAKEAALSESNSKSEFLASMYLSIHEIDLENDTFTEIHSRKNLSGIINRTVGNASEVLTEVMKQSSDETSWDTLIPFVNLSTINERLKGRITISKEFLGLGGKWCRGRFIAMDRMADGNLNHVLWTIEYIDVEKRERELLQIERDRMKFAAEKNAAASQAKSAFLANMSHEIRTPINAVLGMDEMILRESEDKDILGYAANIKMAGTNLLEIVNEILDFSKIEAGKMEILPENYDISVLIADIVNMIDGRAKKKNLDFILHIEPNLPKILYGDSVRLKQCILNLLTNAVKYTKEGNVSLSIDWEKLGEQKLALKISVKDTGIGIKEADLEKLCVPFERIEEEKNKTIEGTGLGMSIVTRILLMMGTRLNVKSEYGKGSEFSFCVEQEVVDWEKVGDINDVHKNGAASAVSYTEKLHAPKARLLFVDDTEINLDVVKGLLKNTGIKIDTALSGKEMLQKVQQEVFDIIFIDHRMPEMDGIESLHAMQKLGGNLCKNKPCIALTANAISGVRKMYLDAGFTDYLSKPVKPEKLEAMIIKYLPAEYLEGTENEILESSRPIDGESSSGESSEDESVTLVEDEQDAFLEKLKIIQEIDTDSALMNCGTSQILEFTLKKYYETIDSKAVELQQLFESEDWENYGIKIHALKTTSRLIGLAGLAKKAEHLEHCAENNEIGEIQKKHGLVLKDFMSYKEKLRILFQEDETKENSFISAEDFSEKIKQIEEFVDNFDIDGLDSVMEELAKCKIPEEFEEKFVKIRALVESVDFIALKELLQSYNS